MPEHLIKCNSIIELDDSVRKIISLFPGYRFFAISGEMGAGKTTFIKTFCSLMGVEQYVSSPTFSLVNEYHNSAGDTFYHFDFYRINKLQEVYDIGYEHYFYSDAWCLVEWPEKIRELLPENIVYIEIIEKDKGQREIFCSNQ